MWGTGVLDGELLRFNIRPQETWNCFSIADCGGSPWHSPQAHTGRSLQTERGRCRAHAFVRVFGCRASKAEARWVNANQKRQVLALLHRGVHRGPGEGTEPGETWAHEGLKNLMPSRSCLSLKPLQAA